jgi:dihydrofolate reductase
MPKLIVFNQVSTDGFIADLKGDMSWAHKHDAEWDAFVSENARGESRLLFGRKTYEMMARFWPSPEALERAPVLAERMNRGPKVVFSRTLKKASWNNTKLVKGNLAAAVRRLKKSPGPDMAIFGSGSIVSQLAQEGLIDEFQVVVNPIVLGKGKSMFGGVARKIALVRTRTRVFGNGNVLLCYQPAP